MTSRHDPPPGALPMAGHALDAPDDPVDDAHKRTMILWAMCASLIAVVASVSGLNVAQQDLALELGAGQSELLWVINGYTIALAALLLPLGAIGDRFGRKKLLLGGLVLFVAANIAAATAGSVDALLVSRIVGGVAAAMIMPATLSMITSTFPAEDRDRAVGVWAGVAGAGGILGLFSSSVVVDNFTWPWVFALPIVVAVIGFVMTAVAAPHSHEHTEARFDTAGSVLSAVAVGALVLGIHEGPESGWTAPLTAAALAVGLVAAIAFVVRELRFEHPLLDVRVFRDRLLASGSVTLLVAFGVMSGLFLVLVQYLQVVLGYSAVKASASLMPMAAVMMPLSAVAPLIARRVGPRAMFVSGMSLMAAGLAAMASMASVEGGYWSIAPGLLVLAVGIGLVMTPGTTAITGSLPPEEQGVASALNDTVREVGAAVGVALLGSIMAAGYSSAVTPSTEGLPADAAHAVSEGIGGAVGVSMAMTEAGFGDAAQQMMGNAKAAFLDGWTLSMWVSAAMALAVAALAALWTPGRAHANGPLTEPGGSTSGPHDEFGESAQLESVSSSLRSSPEGSSGTM